jgi:hypothetical protein
MDEAAVVRRGLLAGSGLALAVVVVAMATHPRVMDDVRTAVVYLVFLFAGAVAALLAALAGTGASGPVWAGARWDGCRWGLLGLVVVVLGVFGVRSWQDQIEQRNIKSAELSAEVISGLVVSRNVTANNLDEGAISTESKADMDADVAELVGQGSLVGLEVWAQDGRHLLYADQGFSLTADSGDSARLGQLLARIGASGVVACARGEYLDEVLLSPVADRAE